MSAGSVSYSSGRLAQDDAHMSPQISHQDNTSGHTALAIAVNEGAHHCLVPARIRSLEVLHDCHDAVFARHAERFGSMSALDILRESITILRAKSSTLMSLMLLLICPVSTLLLSRSLLHGGLANKVSAHLYAAAGYMGLLHYLSLVKSIYESLLQVLLLYTFSAPILLTIGLLGKASIIFIVSCSYSDSEVSLFTSISAGAHLWRRVFCTYFWSCLILGGFSALAVAVFLIIISVLDALQFSADLVFLTELALGLFYSVIFAQILVVGNLANVVCVLEEHCGLAALVRSFSLIKGKIQVALSLFCGMLLGTFMVESLYRYRVLGIPPSNYAINTASRMWEGPLLIFMYSFLLLLGGIMDCVFYFTCKSSTLVLAEKLQFTGELFADV